MRLQRRLNRLMSSVFRKVAPQYSPLQSGSTNYLGTPATSIHRPQNSNQNCCGCCSPSSTLKDLHPSNTPSAHRWSQIREFLSGHLPSLTCLWLVSLRLIYPDDGIITYALTTALIVVLLIGLGHLIEVNSCYAPNVPDKARFAVDLPNPEEFPVWRVVTLKPKAANSAPKLKCIFILQVRRICVASIALHVSQCFRKSSSHPRYLNKLFITTILSNPCWNLACKYA